MPGTEEMKYHHENQFPLNDTSSLTTPIGEETATATETSSTARVLENDIVPPAIVTESSEKREADSDAATIQTVVSDSAPSDSINQTEEEEYDDIILPLKDVSSSPPQNQKPKKVRSPGGVVLSRREQQAGPTNNVIDRRRQMLIDIPNRAERMSQKRLGRTMEPASDRRRQMLTEIHTRAARMSQILWQLQVEDPISSDDESERTTSFDTLDDIEHQRPTRRNLNDSPHNSVGAMSYDGTVESGGSSFLYIDTMSDTDDNNNKKGGKESSQASHTSLLYKLQHYYRLHRKEFIRYKVLKIIQVLLAIVGGILTLSTAVGLRDPETGLIVDQDSPERTENGLILVNGTERSIVASTHFQVICIGITRMSAFFMYPALVMVYFSKFRATTSFLLKSPLAMHMYKDSHDLHVYCGWTILIFSVIHSVFHIARWAQQGNLYLLFQHFSGLTGVLIILSCLLICIPMTIFRTQIRYEIRKRIHYLFILFAIALIFHTPKSAIPNGGFTGLIFGTLIIWYLLDAVYCFFFMTEKIDTTKFSVMHCGVRITMDVSERFQRMGNKGGVAYVCLPWIDKNQWHAFSLFENPTNPAERQIFVQKTGDWTSQVHRVLQRDTVRPAWISGPFPSPYDNAISYDNQILVASGIGITPALSVIRAHKDTRRINLVWVVRDDALLEFFLSHMYLDHDGWNLIYYTGKKKLRHECIRLDYETNVCIIQDRPNLKELIPNIIYGIESGIGLPENYSPGTKVAASDILANQLLSSKNFGASRRTTSTADSYEFVQDLALQASELGFDLSKEAIEAIDAVAEELDGVVEEPDPHQLQCRRLSDDSIRLSASIRQNLTISFRPWDHHEEASQYVKGLNKSLVMPTWGLLYCGGAKQVNEILDEISDEYEIDLHVESFAW